MLGWLKRWTKRPSVCAPTGMCLRPTGWVVYIRPRKLGDANAGFYTFGGDYGHATAFAQAMLEQNRSVHLYGEIAIK